ncbi:MAG: SsrA-binding protein SmpB [Pirellulaceae bacterium]
MARGNRKKTKADKAAAAASGERKIAENRRARHRYEIQEKLECGIMLVGSEVKSLRDGKLSLDEAYVRYGDGELWLVGADIPEYKQATIWNHDPKRPRKLLVHAEQLKKLAARTQEKGLTIVPMRVYFNARGIVKVMIGVGRGKKLHDKRSTMKERDVKRQIDRAMRRG